MATSANIISTDAKTTLAPPNRRRGWGARLLRGILFGVVGLMVVLLIIVLTLQTGFGRNAARGIAVGQIQNLLAEGATIQIAQLGGNVLTNAELAGIVITQDGDTTASIDTLRMHYNLLALLNRTFSADEFEVTRPIVIARQLADSTYNFQHLLKPREVANIDTSASPFAVKIDSALVSSGRVEAHFYSPDGDSTLVLRDISLSAANFSSKGDQLDATLHELTADAIAPQGASRADIAVAGSITQEALSLDNLHVSSTAGTDVRGNARFLFGGGVPNLTADLTAAPLALEDVRAFSGLELYGNPRIRLTARYEEDHLSFAVQGELHQGATIAMDGSLERADRLRYQVEGQLRGVNPAELTRNESYAANLNGDLRIDLTGTSVQTLDGPFAVNLTATMIGDQPIDYLRADGYFRTGRVAFGVDADVPGLRVHAEGDARPFDETPIYEFSGEADDVNLARLLRDPRQTTSFSGTFDISGTGIDPRTMDADAIVDLRNVRVGSVELDYVDAVARMRQGGVRFALKSNVANGGGLIEALGEVEPFGKPLAYRVTDGHVSNLNVVSLTGNPRQESDLTGSFTIAGTGTNASTIVADLTASLRDSRFGEYEIVAANMDGSLEHGLLSLHGRADLGRVGSADFTGAIRPFDTVLSYDFDGRVDHLDLAELMRNPDRPSDISGRFTARGSGLDLASLSLSATIDLEYSSYRAQEVTGGRIALRLIEGNFSVDGSLETPEGTFALDASGRPFDPNPTLTLGDGMCFGGIDLATLTSNPDLRTRLNGCFRGRVQGFDLATMSAEGRITLQPSTFNNAEIQSGSIDLTMHEGEVDANANIVLTDRSGDESGLDFRLHGRPFDENPTYVTSGSLTRVDLVALTGLDQDKAASLSLNFDLQGEGLSFETMSLRGQIDGGSSKLGTATLDTLRTQFDLNRGRLAIDTLLLRSDIADAEGRGAITLTDEAGSEVSDLAITATIYDLSPLNAYMAQPLSLGEGELELMITGEPGAPLHLDARLAAQRFAYGTTALSAVNSHLSGTFNPTSGDLNLRNRLDFKFLSRPAVLVERGSIELTYDGVEITADGSVRVDRMRSFEFASRFDITAEEKAAIIDQLNLDLGDEIWSLVQPARISIGEGYRFENLLLQAENETQQIAADGVVDPKGEQAFILSIEGFEAESVADLFGFEGLGGSFTTTLLMTGSAANPEISGTAALSDFTADGRPVGSIDISVDYANERLDIDARLNHIQGKALTARGFLPLHFSLADVGGDDVSAITEAADTDDVSLAIRADSFQVGWIEPFLNQRTYTAVSGILNADITVDGTQADPQLKGRARLEAGRLGLAFTGRVFETLTGAIRFAGNRAIIQRATLTDADGTERMNAQGTVTLQKLSLGELDIRFAPEQLLAMQTPTYDGLVIEKGTDSLRLTGTIPNPVLRGTAVLTPGTINMTDELLARQLEDVSLTAADLRIIESRFGRRISESDTSVSRFYRSLDLDVDVQLGSDVWLRSDHGLLPFAIEFSGTVQAVKAPQAEKTSMYGTVDVTRGWVETLSRRFEIERGTLVFNGVMEETLVDLQAKLEIRTDPQVGTTAVEIGLLVSGRLGEDLSIILTSTPQLDDADIVSLIVTGRLAENAIGGGALAGAGEGFFLGQLSGIAEGLGSSFGESLGFSLDVVQIDQTPDGLVIRLGKYLTNKAFVSLGLPVNTGGNNLLQQNNAELSIEYTLLRWLLLQLQYQNGVGGGLIFEYAY